MADDWSDFKKPAPAPAAVMTDPWSEFKAPATTTTPATTATPPPSQPIDPSTGQPWKSTGNSFLDFLTKPRLTNQSLDTSSPEALALAKQRDPTWQPTGDSTRDLLTYPRAKREDVLPAAMDTGLSLQDAATFGYGTKLLGAQKNVAQANENLGVLSPLVQGVGYVAGPGKLLGPLARGGAALTGLGGEGAGLLSRTGASMLAGGTEGAAAGGLGAAGHDQNVAEGMLTGGVTGTVGGALGGSGPAPKAPEVGEAGSGSVAPTGMYAEKNAAYAPLDSIYYDRRAAIRAANQGLSVIKARADPANLGAKVGLTPEIRSIVNDLTDAPVVTGTNFQKASQALRNLDGGSNVNAHRIADQFDATLQNTTPIQGGSSGDAWKAKQAGDTWYGRIEDLNRLSEEGPQGQPGPTASAIQQTKKNYDPNSVEGQSLSNLQAAQKPGLNWWHVKHIAAPLMFGGASAAEHAFDPNDEHPMLRAGLHAATAASLFSGLPAVLAPNSARQLNEARYAIGTGQPASTATGRVGNSLLQLMLGRNAAGQGA